MLISFWLTCAFLRFAAAMFVSGPRIFGDELEYWSVAHSFHHGMQFVAFNTPFDIPSQLYSVLLSPLFAAGDTAIIYPLVKLVSSLMLCAVIFPAYGLARELLDRREALLVAVLSLLIPGGVYTATVMTENLYYPVFVLTTWLAYRALYYGRLRDALWAGLSFAVAYYTKPHILFLMMAYGVSLAVWSVVGVVRASSMGAGVRELFPGLLRRCLPFVLFACGLVVRVWETAGVPRTLSLVVFGASYAGIVQLGRHSLPFIAFLRSGTWLVIALIMSTAWLPLLSTAGSLALWRRWDEKQRWFWILTALTTATFLVMVTRHNVLNDDVLRTHERYVLQLSPLFFTWFFAVRRLLSRLWLGAAAAAMVLAVCLAVARSTALLNWNQTSDSPTYSGIVFFHLRYPEKAPILMLLFVLGGGVLCLLALLPRRSTAIALWLAAFLVASNIGWYALEFTVVKREVRRFNDMALYLKSAIPPLEPVGLLQDDADVRWGWYANFWLLQPFTYYGWKQHPDWWTISVSASADGGLDFGNSRPRYLLASDSVVLPYPAVREFPEYHLRLYNVPPALAKP